LLNDKNIFDIKGSAKKFAIDQKFLVESDTENLEKFATYAYQYHFLWPKTSFKDEISYPTVALDTYLDFMSNGVAAKISAGGANAAIAFGGLNSRYLKDYLNTLKIYDQKSVNLNPTQLKELQDEINKTQEAIDSNNLLLAALNPSIQNSAVINTRNNPRSNDNALLSFNQRRFANAVNTYRKLRNDQLKKLDAYKKAISGSELSNNRVNAVNSAFNSFSSKFSSPLLASIGSSGALGQNSRDANTSGEEAGNKSSSFNNQSSAGYSSDIFKNNSMTYPGTRNTNTDDKKSEGAQANKDDDDKKNIIEAISAQSKLNHNQIQSTDDDSLFERVTKAYFRNYDKILKKKIQENDIINKK